MRALILAVAILLPAAAPAAAAPLDLERVTVADLQARMAAGELTSVALTKAYLERIAALNNRGPGLNAVRLVNPDALTDAALLDLERTKTGARGPLHGIPVLVKDNLDVAGLPTAAGAIALEHSIATQDSTVVARLRSAGAVILGKTNLSEFANFITNSNPSGSPVSAARCCTRSTPTRTRAARPRVRRPPRPPRWPPRRSAPRPPARSSARRRRRASSACARPSVS